MEGKKRILLVEDEAITALSEKKWLEREGFEVINVAKGEQAIEAVRSSPGAIDLILMDIDLGREVMDGTEAARIILKDYDIPLLFLSSHTEKAIVEKTETISSYGYVVKGSDNTVLLASIKMAFKLFNANRKLAESKDFFEQAPLQIKQMEELLRIREKRLTYIFDALSESNSFNKTLLQTIPFGMDIVDETGTILFVNDIFEKKFGKGAIGKKCWEIYREDKTQCTDCPLHSGISIGETETTEIHDPAGDKYFEMTHTGLYFHGEKAMLEIFQDITNRKKSELQLNKYAEDQKTANETKDKFFSILAHDLKGPFSGFLGLTEDLKNNLRELKNNEISEYAFLLNSNARRLYELLNNLLEWSRLQGDRMEFQPAWFNICNEIQNTIELFYPSAAAKSIFITNEVDIRSIVYADQNMVSTIIRNLISNSIKFTNEGGRIHITSKQAGDYLEISVSDTGIGMAKEIADGIFSPGSLYTTRGTNNETGSGLGLVLCKELVKKNGGEIRMESTLNKGTTFSFTLPVSKPV